MIKTLAICPSMGRPGHLIEMINSFDKTASKHCKLLLCFEDSDKFLSENLNIAIMNKIDYHIFKGERLVEIFNKIYEIYKKDYDYFHLTNDDVIYSTKNWDRILSSKKTLGYGDDGTSFYSQKGSPMKRFCTFPSIPVWLCNRMGFLCYPQLTHFNADILWQLIGDKLGCIDFFPEVRITHKMLNENDPQTKLRDKIISDHFLAYELDKIN